jgi:hypothetical protein
MSEVKCDNCTGLACGDECDGKSHATTKIDEEEARQQEYAEDVARQEALESLYTYDEGGFCDGFTRY